MRNGTLVQTGIIPVFAVLLLLSGCNDERKFIEKMNLTEDEAALAKPVLADYVKKVEKVFADLEKQRPAGGPPPQPQGGNFGNGQQGPDKDQMRDQMDKARAEFESKFELIDAQTAGQFSAFLPSEKVEKFKQIAVEYRQEKMKSGRKPPGGRNGSGNGDSFDGPPQ